MLCELYKHHRVTGEIDPAFVSDAIASDQTWGLRWQYPGIINSDDTDDGAVVREVADILTMFRFLESSYAKLSPDEKRRLETETAPFGKDVRFTGFDGNDTAGHYGVANFMINNLGRFEEFRGRDLNSHSSISLTGYR